MTAVYREGVTLRKEAEGVVALCVGEAVVYALLHLLHGKSVAQHLRQCVQGLLRHLDDVIVEDVAVVAARLFEKV